jgi:probable rRNA maturation factor
MSIEVLNESGAGLDPRELSRLSRFVLERMRVHPMAELCIKLVDEPTIAELNEHWMEKAGPTDVLAFPMDELHDHRIDEDDEDAPPTLLGDVVLCPTVAAAQAAKAGHSAQAELHLLCTHGVLHLLGYDHGDQAEEREMFGVQTRLLESWSVARQR